MHVHLEGEVDLLDSVFEFTPVSSTLKIIQNDALNPNVDRLLELVVFVVELLFVVKLKL